ncbi:MAG: DUF2752 domain-containing protein [Bacteroidales bacterium]|nr:DUF2752 domain-containing protein [Bacteroidales bacterium]
MTLLKGTDRIFHAALERLKHEPYLAINAALAGVIMIALVYSGIFSPDRDNYPVSCIHERLTGEPCFSCGLSHSFSLIVRGRIEEAYTWNPYGMQVFIFFAAQLLLRLIFPVLYTKYPGTRKQLIILDIGGSILLYFIAFMPFLVNLFSSIIRAP